MIALCQRVTEASVTVQNICAGKIGLGWLVLLGVFAKDTEKDAQQLAQKIINLRGFSDEAGHLNLDLAAVGGEVLVVSQFTLCADTSKGNRPSFTQAAPSDQARFLYELFVKCFKERGINTQTGEFGASMSVQLCNSGPVTFSLTT